MKNFKTLLLIAVFTLGVGGVANAQKMGHIDFEKLVAEMPQTKQLKVDMEKLGKTYQDEVESMAKKLDAKMKKYGAEQNSQAKEIVFSNRLVNLNIVYVLQSDSYDLY